MSEIEALNQKYVNEHSSVFEDSKFYVEDDVVREVYYNPDSNSGGQLVTNLYPRSAIVDAYEKYSDADSFWDYLESTAKQYLTDIDTSKFASEAKEFVESTCDFNGNNEETMNALCKWAGTIEQNLPEQGMEMGGM
ncbi:hypothetical protein [Erysipelothrix anatis]|uniref:hypothetical protein n=1 Tax=Erysipelothrix anatis TaxID=2683713 RepID=UPI0014084ACE|nr:hypothetical protein [Erysipelothrix anatis]